MSLSRSGGGGAGAVRAGVPRAAPDSSRSPAHRAPCSTRAARMCVPCAPSGSITAMTSPSAAAWTTPPLPWAGSGTEVLETTSDDPDQSRDGDRREADGSVRVSAPISLDGTSLFTINGFELRSPVRVNDQYVLYDGNVSGIDADGDGRADGVKVAYWRVVVGDEPVEPAEPRRADERPARRLVHRRRGHARAAAATRYRVDLTTSAWYEPGVGIVRLTLPSTSPGRAWDLEEVLTGWDGVTEGRGYITQPQQYIDAMLNPLRSAGSASRAGRRRAGLDRQRPAPPRSQRRVPGDAAEPADLSQLPAPAQQRRHPGPLRLLAGDAAACLQRTGSVPGRHRKLRLLERATGHPLRHGSGVRLARRQPVDVGGLEAPLPVRTGPGAGRGGAARRGSGRLFDLSRARLPGGCEPCREGDPHRRERRLRAARLERAGHLGGDDGAHGPHRQRRQRHPRHEPGRHSRAVSGRARQRAAGVGRHHDLAALADRAPDRDAGHPHAGSAWPVARRRRPARRRPGHGLPASHGGPGVHRLVPGTGRAQRPSLRHRQRLRPSLSE